ncbi:MAG: hypothetical protein QOJ96_2751 [Alphaproteobacteria bacterium]|jgi:uncharacterized protein YecE (DUF72 family)|nr:hypothetical protein [Alphaproteobacteria bacterium]
MSESRLWIGTAGWTVPSRYAREVPPGGSQLERYARCLNAVEINSSFHRPHQRKTYERWARSTPDGFRFAVKMPKAMTHAAKLVGCGALLDRFVAEVAGLGDKLSVLLIQLPPKHIFDEPAVDGFLRELRSRINTPLALEARNASWFTPEVDAWLADRQVSRVAADPARVADAGKPGGWNGLVYYRWHGAPRIYFSDYDAAALATLKQRLEQHRARHIPAWYIFDNTASGAALGNALTLSRPA